MAKIEKHDSLPPVEIEEYFLEKLFNVFESYDEAEFESVLSRRGEMESVTVRSTE